MLAGHCPACWLIRGCAPHPVPRPHSGRTQAEQHSARPVRALSGPQPCGRSRCQRERAKPFRLKRSWPRPLGVLALWKGRAAAGPGAGRGAGGGGLSGCAGLSWPGRGAGGPGGAGRCRRAGRVPVVDEAGGVVGWVYMALSCLCGLAGGRLWLVPRCPRAGGRDRTCGPTGNSHSTRKGRCTGPAATSRRLRSATSRPWNRPAPLPAPRPRPTHWPTWAAAPWPAGHTGEAADMLRKPWKSSSASARSRPRAFPTKSTRSPSRSQPRPDHDTRRPAVRRTGLWSPGNDDREAVTGRDLKVTADPGGPLSFAVRA